MQEQSSQSEASARQLRTSPPGSVLLIIGMHRSGTSATTGALQQLGVALGPKLYRGHAHINAKGYFEHSDIADTNEEILLAMGSSWDDITPRPPSWLHSEITAHHRAKLSRFVRRDFSSGQLWALKDPRIARLLPMWKELLASHAFTPAYLFSVRAPSSVSGSLERRDGFSREKSMLLWLLHYLEAERDSRGQGRVFVDYDFFLDHPVAELRRVENNLGISFPRAPESCEKQLGSFLSKDLRTHTSKGTATAPGSFETLATELYAALRKAAVDDCQPDHDTIDAIRDRLASEYAAFSPLVIEHMRTCSQRYGQTKLVLNKLVRSWSWFTGKPVRFVERLIGRDV